MSSWQCCGGGSTISRTGSDRSRRAGVAVLRMLVDIIVEQSAGIAQIDGAAAEAFIASMMSAPFCLAHELNKTLKAAAEFERFF
ncbi:hypothetical protein AM571_CH00736 [Rhizobium etli 8C-3]|uniref:Uncharacterized protein n=2 Tax=Rhizobium etli TaxID=29449 RepID=A0A1L5P0A1_RHIET|nr:hypothetical protein AM571_CH00736 [Rhizobium etli 8C-3]